jgi:hypothetical protein
VIDRFARFDDYSRMPATAGRFSFTTAMLLAALTAAGATGCSTAKFSVGHVMVPVLNNARDAAMASDDLRTFQDGAAANLFLMEGLIRTDPGNDELRLNASMLYFSYAFSTHEETDPAYASKLYRKGFGHAQAILLKNKKLPRDWGVSFDEFNASLPNIKKKEVPAAVWAAANWSQFIALHLDSTAVLRDIPKVTALLDRSAELDGAYFEGLPNVMIGSLHAFRPPMFGGSPEKSAESFETAFTLGDDSFLLSRYFYARYYLYRVMDDEGFRQTLQAVIDAPEQPGDPYRLLNLIARQRSQSLLGEADDLF